jgi:RNAse (barnase) inhibitor barstar
MHAQPMAERDGMRTEPRKILFVKKSGRQSGGHVKFHDYFEHCAAHPQLDPYVYLAYDRASDLGALWDGLAGERVLPRLDIEPFDLLFIDGRDWELLPEVAQHMTVIHLLQDFRHADPEDPRFAFLARPALRICISPELAAAVQPHACGPVAVIPNGIPLDFFMPGAKEAGSVLIWARKDRALGKAIRSALSARGVRVRLLTRPVARAEFARLLAEAAAFVGLTKEREGFFLPALEAMASGCAVVCADALGNRSFCLDGKTCRTPRFGSLDDHVRLVEELLSDEAQRDALCANGIEIAQGFTLERERDEFFRFVGEHMLSFDAEHATA